MEKNAQPFITVEFDNTIAEPRNAGPNGEKTPFLRGTIVGVPAELGDAGKALLGGRIQVWSDTDPTVIKHRAKIVEMVGSAADKFAVDRGEGDQGRAVYRFTNVTVLREYSDEEAAATRGGRMMAQLTGLATAAARVVSVKTNALDAAATAPVVGAEAPNAPAAIPGLAGGGQL